MRQEQPPANELPKKKAINGHSIVAFLLPILVALAVHLGLMEALDQLWDYRPPKVGQFFLYFSLYLFINWIVKTLFFKTEKITPEPHPALQWPMPGPIGRLGPYGMMMTFLPSSLLSLVNPFLFSQQLRQMYGQFKIHKRLEDNETDFSHYQTKVDYRLPFEDEWLVYNGGMSPVTSHSWGILTQRYAYDFVIADSDFSRHQGKGNRLTDYFCYQQPILAAADGEVVSLVNNIGPAPCIGYAVADFMCRNFAGNHLIIKHADGEYGFYAHLIKGSISLQPGDMVKQGAVIGHCGHTGHSSEPHLHFHLQDKPSFYLAMGLPIKFSQLEIDGEMQDRAVHITRGTRVKTRQG